MKGTVKMKKIKLFGMAVLTGLVLTGAYSTNVEAKTKNTTDVTVTKLAKEKSADNAKLLSDLGAKELKPQKDGTYFVQFDSIESFDSTDEDLSAMLEKVNKYIEAKGLKRSEFDLEISHAKYAVVAVLIVHQDKDDAKTDKKSDKKSDKKDDKKTDKKSDKTDEKAKEKSDKKDEVKDSSSDEKASETKEKTDETTASDKA